MGKAEIRKQVRLLKQSIHDVDRVVAADSVFAALERMPAFKEAERVLVYCSLPDELPTDAFLAKWHGRKQLFLPRVKGDDLEVLPYDGDNLLKGAFSIYEPQGSDAVPVGIMDMIIVPAVAYDCKGNRVGRGRGYYDRLLAGVSERTLTVGVCFDCQLLESVDAEPHDKPVDAVISDKRVVILRPECRF